MRTPSTPSTGVPRILVLLATHNGVRWLPEQLDSILAQEAVEVRVVVLDDESTDGTWEWLVEQAAHDARIEVLPRQGASGSSVANFCRLIQQAQPAEGELISFADQDDVWAPRKLARHAFVLRERGVDGVSSNVTSFTEKGKRSLIRKNFPQRRFDYLFESPGPGSTFLITPKLLALTAHVIESEPAARDVEFHDSLIYAIARGAGLSWHIDDESSVDYRQHGNNVMGANVGARSAMSRLQLIREHWLRNHAIALTKVALSVAGDDEVPELRRILSLLTSRGARPRLALARMSPLLRRRPRDQRIIGLLISIGVW